MRKRGTSRTITRGGGDNFGKCRVIRTPFQKNCRKMRTWWWLVGHKKASKPSKCLTPCQLALQKLCTFGSSQVTQRFRFVMVRQVFPERTIYQESQLATMDATCVRLRAAGFGAGGLGNHKVTQRATRPATHQRYKNELVAATQQRTHENHRATVRRPKHAAGRDVQTWHQRAPPTPRSR